MPRPRSRFVEIRARQRKVPNGNVFCKRRTLQIARAYPVQPTPFRHDPRRKGRTPSRLYPRCRQPRPRSFFAHRLRKPYFPYDRFCRIRRFAPARRPFGRACGILRRSCGLESHASCGIFYAHSEPVSHFIFALAFAHADGQRYFLRAHHADPRFRRLAVERPNDTRHGACDKA